MLPEPQDICVGSGKKIDSQYLLSESQELLIVFLRLKNKARGPQNRVKAEA